jgi:hypothetical protein
VGAPRCGLLNRLKKSLMRLEDFGFHRIKVARLDVPTRFGEWLIERGAHNDFGHRVFFRDW